VSPEDYRVEGGLEQQLELCLDHLAAVTTTAGGSSDRVVEIAAFVADADGRAIVDKVVSSRLGRLPPILRFEPVEDVALHGLVELDWVVSLDDAIPIERAAQIIEPLGDLASGEEVIRRGPFAFLNGVYGAGNDMTAASEDAFQQLSDRLAGIGAGIDKVIKMVVYIDSFERYPEFNAVTQRLLTALPLPTRSVVVAPAQAVGAIRIDAVAQP
jgi:enamine deaminase RidA (YjgF/YER057c/UK114 family)